MTMHLVRGMTSLNTKKRKNRKKTSKILEEERKTAELLKKVGYVPNSNHRAEMPSYTVKRAIPCSDYVGNGFKRTAKQYTGDELAGIGTLHKSNMVPVRKDSNDAKEIARMRRG
jgi:ABC-type Mn2+/Zn2+ transport system ATPase subunit